MAQWYVKDLSKLTRVSVQTLHHYDRINLLNPSIRMQNGYRVYSEKDLSKLQQIIALKFFGFELSQISALLSGTTNTLQNLSTQVQFLKQKANVLLEASKTLKNFLAHVEDDKSIPWETIIKSIEVYRMTQQLEHSWVKEIYNQDELKQYVEFETALKANSTPAEQASFEKKWQKTIDDIKKNLHQDPASQIGISIGERCMNWVNNVYGKKYAHLRTKKFEKGFAEGKGLEEAGLTLEMVAWLDKAIDAYWHQRIYNILNQVGALSEDKLLSLWNAVLDDMYGDDAERKKEIYPLAFQDNVISIQAKNWLRKISSK